MKKLSIGIVGLGRLGLVRAQLLRDHPAVASVVYFDPHVKKSEGLERLPSLDHVVGSRDLDAIFVCTPNYLMRTVVAGAVKTGKHVFCEKPPGVSLSDAQYFHRLQQRHRRVVIKFGFNHRYLSHFQELTERIRSRAYGSILWVRGVYGKGYDKDFYTTWRARRALSGGGVLVDQGIHLLDLMLDLVGDLKVVSAQVDRVKWRNTDVEDNVFVQLRSTTGIPISFHSSMAHWKHTLRLEVATDKALFALSGIKSSTRSYGDETLLIYSDWRDNFVETTMLKKNEPDYYTLRLECAEFVEAVLRGKPLRYGTTADAKRVMKVVHDIYREGKV